MSASRTLKSIIFTAASQDSHTSIKVRNVLKWLKSGHEVKIDIKGKADRQKAMDTIFKQLESQARSGAEIRQKTVKPDSIKFFMRPTKDATNIVVDEPPNDSETGTDELEAMTSGKDIFSDDFEKELEESMKSEKEKSRRK